MVHAGDATYRGTEKEVIQVAKSFEKFKVDNRRFSAYLDIIFVPGNHDWLFEKDKDLAMKIMRDHGVEVLINESIDINGFKIWGSPVTPPFCNWAFNWSSRDREDLWKTIPEGMDMIVTHGPPIYIMDEVMEYMKSKHTGCSYLADRIVALKPKYHLFGHIHEGYGIKTIGDTTYVNAAIMDGRYRPVNHPIYVTSN